MAYYKSPEEMFAKRAENAKRAGDRHWAMAKNGEGNVHYGQARNCYNQATANQARAEQARDAGATWGNKR